MESFCKIFIDSALPFDEMLTLITNYLEVERKGKRTVENDILVGDLFFNEDSLKNKQFSNEKPFLFYTYFLEIESKDDINDRYITLISTLLINLWVTNIPSVAACDFEDNLPESGGVNKVFKI